MLPVLVGAIVRIIVSILFVPVINHDTIGWATVGQWTLQGKNIYPYPAYEYHSFFPVFLYVTAAAQWVQHFGVANMLFIKLFCSLFDAGSIYLVYLLSGKRKKAAWLYALNPLPILITCIHGQLESIPVFFLLLSVYLLGQRRPNKSALAISLAAAFKTWPLMFSIPALKRVWKWQFLIIIGLVPVLAMAVYSLFFHASFIDMIHYALFYRGQTGGWGTGYFFHFLLDDKMSLRIFSNAFLLLFAWYSFYNRQKTAAGEVLDQMLFFFILSPTFGLQWLMWIVPFLIIVRPRWYWLFFIAGTIHVGDINLFWIMKESNMAIVRYANVFGLLVWSTLVFIFLNRKLKLRPYLVVAGQDLKGNQPGHGNQGEGK